MALGCDQVAAAVVYRSTTKTTRLPNTASIFSAELYAISLELAVICRSKENKFVIFSDCMSSLQALSCFKLKIHFVQNIIKDYTHLTDSGKQLFYAGYQAMSTLWVMRGLTLQPNQLFHCPLQI